MLVVAVEGTWQKYPWGQLSDLVERLNGPVIRIEYPEQYGEIFSYNESIYIGKRALRRKISKISEPYCLVGYSQGAHIVGDIASEIHDDQNLVKVYLIADPMRSTSDMVIGNKPLGCGVFGQRVVGDKAHHFVAEHDFISACDNAFISNVALYTLDKKNKETIKWIKTFSGTKKLRRNGGSVIRAAAQLRRYLRTQAHSRYHETVVVGGMTATQWIAEDINRLDTVFQQ